MTSRAGIKANFENGDTPTGAHFADLIDSLAHVSEDGLLTSSAAAAAYQPLDPTLTALAGVAFADNKMLYATGVDVFATCDLTSFARTLLDDADAAAMRATLGAQATLVSGTNIKTINGTSLLGSGDIEIEGGGGGSFAALTGSPSDNTALDAALDAKANIVNGTFTGDWFLSGGYFSGGLVPYADGGTGRVGVAIRRYDGTAMGFIFATNSGEFLIENFSGKQIGFSGEYVISNRFAGKATDGSAYSLHFALDTTSAHEGGFWKDASDIQHWGSDRTSRISVDRDGTITLESGKVKMLSLPTSSSGLASGSIWNDSGTLKVVP